MVDKGKRVKLTLKELLKLKTKIVHKTNKGQQNKLPPLFALML